MEKKYKSINDIIFNNKDLLKYKDELDEIQEIYEDVISDKKISKMFKKMEKNLKVGYNNINYSNFTKKNNLFNINVDSNKKPSFNCSDSLICS